MTLGFASEQLRSDPEVVQRALRSNAMALPYAAEQLREDRRFLQEALRIQGVLRHAAEEVRRDRELVLVAVAADGGAMCYAAPCLQADARWPCRAYMELIGGSRGGFGHLGSLPRTCPLSWKRPEPTPRACNTCKRTSGSSGNS